LHSNETFVHQLYTKSLIDLGDKAQNYNGIFSPNYEQGQIDKYIHRQFTKDAESYAKKYHKTNYFKNLICKALTTSNLEIDNQHTTSILDIGSGAGNSVLPLMELFPNSKIIASDLSVELLYILKGHLSEIKSQITCNLLQLNAEELDFHPDSFDMVVGAAILHHLFSPDKTISGCSKILKPGGCAIFFEPFENGNSIICSAYNQILKDERQKHLSMKIRNFLKNRIEFCNIRRGNDKSPKQFLKIDDKWMFTKTYFYNLAKKNNFSECIIYPIIEPSHAFEDKVKVHLKFIEAASEFPEWAWEIIQEYDKIFSNDAKNDLIIEGTIIFKK